MEYVVSVVDRLYEGRTVYLWFFVTNRVIFWRLLPDDVGDDSWTQIVESVVTTRFFCWLVGLNVKHLLTLIGRVTSIGFRPGKIDVASSSSIFC